MNAVIDIGNTNIKLGLFVGETLIDNQSNISEENLINFVNNKSLDFILISSVSFNPTVLIEKFNKGIKSFVLNNLLPLPFINQYKTPDSLGSDRIALVAGMKSLYPHQNCLAVGIGTCITYDLIDYKGVYKGGAISPGPEMKLKALNTFTAKLPLVTLSWPENFLGNTTEQSILSGAIMGTVAEIEGMINFFGRDFPSLKIIICGGGAIFFESKIKGPIFVVPHLALIGLNNILQYNVSKKN